MNIFDIQEIVLEFEIIGKENIATRSVYHIEEESLMTYGGKQETSLCIENTYLTIDIDIDTGLVVGISGFLGDLKKISSTEISDFTFKKGMLIYKSIMHLEKGIGYDIGYKGKILLDKTKRVIVILIENQPRSGEWFCVTTNISVLLNLGKLCEIRIKI